MILRTLRRHARRIGAKLFGHVLGSRLLLGEPRPKPHPNELARILVIRIDERVGNVLLTSPLFTSLRRAFPAAKIDALIAASKRTLVESTINVIPFERRHFFTRPLQFARQMLELRRTRYDAAIDASHWHEFSASSAMLLAWTKAPLRIAHARGYADLYANELIAAPASGNEIEAKLRLLAPLGLEPNAGEMSTALGTGGEAKSRIAGWLANHALDARKLVALAPGSRKLDHRVPPELFAALGRDAAALGAAPIVLWGPGEEALADEVAKSAGATVAPPTSLDELAALMRACAVVITNDTGPMHLSVACAAPTIALFTQPDHQRWGHAYPPHLVIPFGELGLDESRARAKAHLEKVLGRRE
jgi:ADP-heptose:LPS heptosyltransferase